MVVAFCLKPQVISLARPFVWAYNINISLKKKMRVTCLTLDRDQWQAALITVMNFLVV
jgi:hypothetical protein